MDRTRMYRKRNRMIYVNEVLNFVDVAKKHASIRKTSYIRCPCVDYWNILLHHVDKLT